VTDDDDELIGIVAGAVVAVLALLAAVIVFCVVCRRRLRKYPDDKPLATVGVAASRLPINFGGRSDVVVTAAGGKPLNGGVPTYGSHSSPAAAMLLPPGDVDLYDDDDPTKMASVSRDGSYRRPHDVFQRRQLPELPRIPVDSAGVYFVHSLCHSSSQNTFIQSRLNCQVLQLLKAKFHYAIQLVNQLPS